MRLWGRRDEQRSAAGDPILRHTRGRRGGGRADGDEALMRAIEAHVEAHVGEVALVWHELVSSHVHMDVLVVDPTEERPWRTLVTVGMSQRPMGKRGDQRFGELVMALPPMWPIERPDGRGATWPVGLLQFLGRLPHEYSTTLWAGHTVPNDDPPRPYDEETELCGVILSPFPLLTPDPFARLDHDGHEIHFLGVVALHAAEMDYKLEHGSDALFDKLDEVEASELLLPDRECAV